MVSRIVRNRVVGFVFCTLAAGAASAQTATPAPRNTFVEGAILGSIEGKLLQEAAMPWGGGLSVGVPVPIPGGPGGFGLRFDFEVPKPGVHSSYGFGYRYTEATQNTTLAAMLVYHLGSRQSIGLMAGVFAIAQDVDRVVVEDPTQMGYLGIGGPCPCYNSWRPVANPPTNHKMGYSVGAEIAVPVTRHLAIVPQVRLHGNLDEGIDFFAARFRAAIRWKF